MNTPGPETSTLTSVCDLPQKEQRYTRLGSSPSGPARAPNGWWVGFSPNTTLSAGNTGKSPAVPAVQASAALEVDALVDRLAEQMATQAVQPHLDGAGADPVAIADQPCLARHRARYVGDADAH